MCNVTVEIIPVNEIAVLEDINYWLSWKVYSIVDAWVWFDKNPRKLGSLTSFYSRH